LRLLALTAALAFHGSVHPLSAGMRARMTGVSWHVGCPVALSQLRLLKLSYLGFDGRTHTGQLIVNAQQAAPLVSVFRKLYALRYPIRRMVPVDVYGADDFQSIEHDNTSAFNCRLAEGSSHWSQHAYGLAVDLNPLENPYVSNGKTSHKGSVKYLDRSKLLPGVITPAVVAAFKSIGWGWGGDWSGSVKDYQHFSSTGH
jgi:hypothetical protein